ncbi:helix-turn-helix transcriptional regulator [Micromonospora sp. NPDC049101]|uniref:response regulator transcription factor n=1 Tax=Micromonospora sp. NPDC049101 TaxID=3155032 RepID=UPI0033E8475E
MGGAAGRVAACPAAAPHARSVDLDDEERRLLRAISAGRTTVDIAEELHVSERAVKRLTAALLRRLRVSNRAEAAAVAGHTGLLDDCDPPILGFSR